MALLDIFNRKNKNQKESNTLFGQTALGNNILRNTGASQALQQMLYVTTSSATQAGRTVDMSVLSRNSTVMACLAAKARALSQLPIQIMAYNDKDILVNACHDPSIGARDKIKARQVYSLLTNPNNFQSQYEFWYQFSMWLDMAGECYTVLWRKDQNKPDQTPLEMYVLDATLITTQLTETRYPMYVLSTPTYGFSKNTPLDYWQVIHLMEMGWQGSGGWNKGTLLAELVGLDQDIDLYANYVMQNGAKPSGLFVTDQVIPDSKYKEIAARLKEGWSQLTGSRPTDPSKPGQGMLLDNGMKYMPVDMLSIQDADLAALKEQTMKRICGVFGVPPQMISVGEGKFNNTQSMLDEFYKSTISPLLTNVEQKLKMSLLQGFPNLHIQFQTENFLKGAPLDQMNYSVAGVNAGIFTPNEARKYLGLAEIDDSIANSLNKSSSKSEPIAGSSPQDTGGGGNVSSVGKTGRAGKA
jgi:HK97 family phage portal protein